MCPEKSQQTNGQILCELDDKLFTLLLTPTRKVLSPWKTFSSLQCLIALSLVSLPFLIHLDVIVPALTPNSCLSLAFHLPPVAVSPLYLPCSQAQRRWCSRCTSRAGTADSMSNVSRREAHSVPNDYETEYTETRLSWFQPVLVWRNIQPSPNHVSIYCIWSPSCTNEFGGGGLSCLSALL